MTIHDAIERGISKLRLAQWVNPQAHIEFDIVQTGDKVGHGPWVRLHDSCSHAALKMTDPQTYLWTYLIGDDKEDWQEYEEAGDVQSN